MVFKQWINQKYFFTNSTALEVNNQQILTEQSIKLSVITQFFPPDYAATGQLIEELVTHLGQQGVEIEVFTSQPGYAFSNPDAPAVEQLGSVRIKRSHIAGFWRGRIRGKALHGVLFTFRAILHLLKVGRRQNLLLLTTAPPFLPILGYLAHLLFRIPYICIIYDLYPDIAIALGVIAKNHWLVRLWQGLNQRIWLKAKGIVVLSPMMKQKLTAICPQIEDKISVISSWADPNVIAPIPKQENWFAWKYKLVKQFTVLYSGNMGRCHDMKTILATAIKLKDEPIQFVCIGSGAKFEELRQEVNRLELGNFMFLPYQEKEVLPHSLTACDLSLVSVDAQMESFVAPSKLYSALATGRPVAAICSENSYLRQIVTEANCGGSFENGDSKGLAQFIRLLNSDRELAERMGRAGRQYLQTHCTPEIIAKQYLKVLHQAIL